MTTKKRYNYIKKKLAQGTWPSIFTAILSFLLMGASIMLSVLHEGKGPLVLGALGASSMVMALFGLFYMIAALHDEDKNYLPVKISGTVNAALLVAWIVLIAAGLR